MLWTLTIIQRHIQYVTCILASRCNLDSQISITARGCRLVTQKLQLDRRSTTLQPILYKTGIRVPFKRS